MLVLIFLPHVSCGWCLGHSYSFGIIGVSITVAMVFAVAHNMGAAAKSHHHEEESTPNQKIDKRRHDIVSSANFVEHT